MKLVKILLAAALVAAMVLPAVAEDRLKLNGEMRVRGWYQDWSDGDIDPLDGGTRTWADQRLRIGGNIAVAEGVSVTFRFDVTESNWGTTGGGNGFGSGRSGSDGSNQWDRAHLDLNKGNFHLRAGQFLQVYSMTDSLDAQDNGFSMDYKLNNGSVNAFFQVDDCNEAGSPSNCKAAQNQDTFLYGAKYSGKFDSFGLDVYGGNWHGDEDFNVYLVGVNAMMNFGAFKISAAYDHFDGDHDSSTDAFGDQLMVDGSFAFSEKFTLGGQLFYAKGDDEDVQYTRLGNGFNGWDPIMDVGTNLSNEQIVFGSPFNLAEFGGGEAGSEFSVASLGSMGGRIYMGFKASDTLKFGASAAYLQEEDDSYVSLDGYALAAGMVWSLMPNTSFHVQAQYVDGTISAEDSALKEEFGNKDYDIQNVALGAGLYVNF
jgi:hypothetical protein